MNQVADKVIFNRMGWTQLESRGCLYGQAIGTDPTNNQLALLLFCRLCHGFGKAKYLRRQRAAGNQHIVTE